MIMLVMVIMIMREGRAKASQGVVQCVRKDVRRRNSEWEKEITGGNHQEQEIYRLQCINHYRCRERAKENSEKFRGINRSTGRTTALPLLKPLQVHVQSVARTANDRRGIAQRTDGFGRRRSVHHRLKRHDKTR